MIRNDVERHKAQENIEKLRAGLEEILGRQPQGYRTTAQGSKRDAVADAIRMQIEDLEREVSLYDDLKEGRKCDFTAESLDELGEVVTMARVSRGLSQADLAEQLNMTQQQVARYERDSWQKISLWRLAEVAELLGVEVYIRSHLSNSARGMIDSAS